MSFSDEPIRLEKIREPEWIKLPQEDKPIEVPEWVTTPEPDRELVPA